MTRNELIAYRLYKEEDKNFIFSTWLRNLYHGNTWFNEIPKNIFMQNYHKVIASHIDTKVIKIAYLKDDTDSVLGYAVYDTDEKTIHFLYVKKAWRGIGIAKNLVPVTIDTATNLTNLGLKLAKKKNIKFNPFLS